MQQRLERGQKGHEQRRPFLSFQFAQLLVDSLGNLECFRGSSSTLSFPRLPSVRGQLQHRKFASQLSFPICELLVEQCPSKLLPLPYGVVGVLHRKLR